MKRSADSPAFLLFGLTLGTSGLLALVAATKPVPTTEITSALLLAAVALTMRLNRFTIPPSIIVSLVYTVQFAAVVLLGGPVAAWISLGTFLLSLLVRPPSGVRPRVLLAVASFNVGLE